MRIGALAPDGRRFVATLPLEVAESEITDHVGVVFNWDTELAAVEGKEPGPWRTRPHRSL